MQTVGVICEYNPFHLGHARQLAAIRHQLGQDAAIVCLMSGNYVQRGEPAVFDKLTRAPAVGGGLRRGRRADLIAAWLRVSQLRLRIRERGGASARGKSVARAGI